MFTSKGMVATSGAQTSDVNVAPVGTNIVLTCPTTTNHIVSYEAVK
jgi:hypothetical protein